MTRGHKRAEAPARPLPESRVLSPHHDDAVNGWAEVRGALLESNRSLSKANKRLWIVIIIAVTFPSILYKSTRTLMFAREVDANGVGLRTTKLELVDEASEGMKRDAVRRFFRSLRSSSMDLRHQDDMSREVAALTAAGSPAHQVVEAFGEQELPQRRELEIDAQVTVHALSENRWRADIVEVNRHGERKVFAAYATIDLAPEAERNVDFNPWGVFVRSFSIDPGGER
jgi:type IV secretory pathway TrbF-like protein